MDTESNVSIIIQLLWALLLIVNLLAALEVGWYYGRKSFEALKIHFEVPQQDKIEAPSVFTVFNCLWNTSLFILKTQIFFTFLLIYLVINTSPAILK